MNTALNPQKMGGCPPLDCINLRLPQYSSVLLIGIILLSCPLGLRAQSNVQVSPQLPPNHTVSSGHFLETGRQLFAQEQFAAAAASWQTAAADYAAQGDFANQALSLNYASLAHQKLGQWSTAKQAIHKSLKVLGALSTPEPILSANALNTQAGLLLATGKSQEAIHVWEQSRKFYQLAQDFAGDLGCQLNQARAWQHLGFYRRAHNILMGVKTRLQTQQGDPALQAKGLHSLGITLQSLGELEESWTILAESLVIAQKHRLNPHTSAILLSLGNVSRDLSQPELALDYFRRAETTASLPLNQLEAQLNQLGLLLDLKRIPAAQALVPKITQQLRLAPPGRRSIYNRINFIENLLKWEIGQAPLPPKKIERILKQALTNAIELEDGQAGAYVLTQQGKFLAHYNRTQQATTTTERALAQAQGLQAADIIAQAAWQLGQLQVRQGDRQAAIAAYRQAVLALQSLRGDLASIETDIQFSFRDRVEPIYRELVELLLNTSHPTQAEIIEARDLIEGLQVAELDNFFREACADLEPITIDKIDPHAAVIYPIILKNRTAVIVSRSGHDLKLYPIDRPQQLIKEEVNQLLEVLSIVYDYQEQNAQTAKMYNWLIRPAEKDQILDGVQTLIFVLDKELRNVPMAALHDGQQYLIEKYRIALAPGLQLLKPRPLAATKLNVVSGGLSKSRQGFPPLPGVQTEIHHLTQTLKTSVLLDQEFTRPKLTEQLTESPASIVHLATHGQFSSNIDETFLLTWDGRLKLREFSQLLAERDTKQTPEIELLVLSACQTAVGDDRAVLGIAGFAIRSGARSTLATLWAVRDQSTAAFMNKFYEHIRQPGTTKAEAVQQAQLSLIKDPSYKAPFFWAPFVLVGNWL